MKVKTALHFFSFGGRFYRPPFINVNEFEKFLGFIVWNLVRQSSAKQCGGWRTGILVLFRIYLSLFYMRGDGGI